MQEHAEALISLLKDHENEQEKNVTKNSDRDSVVKSRYPINTNKRQCNAPTCIVISFFYQHL